MKEGLRVSDEMGIQKTFVPDVDADDAKASGMLGMISREAEGSESEEKSQPVVRTGRGASPFLLEALYFRSFGERGLLNSRRRNFDRQAGGPWDTTHSGCSASSRKSLVQIQTDIRSCRQR